MSCSSAATISTSGRATRRISARRLDAGLDDVPVDGEPVDRRGVRQQPDPLPLGQDPRPARRSPRASPTPRAGRGPAASSRTSSWRASSGHGLRQRRALAHQPGRGRRGEHDVALGGLGGRAQQQQRVLGRAGRRRSSTTSPPESATPGATGVRSGRRGRAEARPGQHGVDAAPGQPGQVGDPAAELADVHLGGRGVRQPERVRRGRRPVLGRDPVGRPGRRPSCSTSRTSSSGLPAALQVGVRHVDQPGRDQRLEHGRVAQPALGLLEVGHRDVRQLADQVVPAARPARAARAAGPARRGATARASSCAAGGSGWGRRRGAGRRAARARPAGRRRRRSSISETARTEWSSFGAGVPERVPDLLAPSSPSVDARRRATSTTSRSEYGASSARP